MSVIGSNILAGASGQGGGYNLTKSLRFRSSANAYLNRTFSTGNRLLFTFSAWVKRGSLTGNQNIFGPNTSTSGSGTYGVLRFVDGNLEAFDYANGTINWYLATTPVYRDPSAWYHIVMAYDSAQATSSNRVKLYVNGVQVTAFSYAAYPSPSYQGQWNDGLVNYIGTTPVASQYFDGYLAEVNFIDGQALTPSSFGETSTTTGVWIPKKYTGTYGTNGFYLPFTDTTSTSTLGTDFSGNSNTWTVNNISLTSGSTYDSMTDVPTLTSATTANYAVLNPLQFAGTNGNLPSDGNLTVNSNGSGNPTKAFPSTIAASSGKFYAEFTISQTQYIQVAVADVGTWTSTYGGGLLYGSGTVSWDLSQLKYYINSTSSTATGVTGASNDVMQIAFDADTRKVWFGRNNTWNASGDPSAGTGEIGTVAGTGALVFVVRSENMTTYCNFGQRPFAYTPPTGFVALNTFNLPTPTIGATASSQANDYFDATLYTGNGATYPSSQSITGLQFQPDFTWIKSRSNAYPNFVFDAVRGAGKELVTNDTAAETNKNQLSAFNSNGFSVAVATDGSLGTNGNGSTFVAWNWKANGAGSTNTAGSITSTVSANTTAGFSIVTYTGTGANATVGHGLGVTPAMVIVKRRSGTQDWAVWHQNLSGGQYVLYLNLTAAEQIANITFQGAPTSTVLQVGTSSEANGSSQTYVAYCFAPIAGYSAFGSYTGNGSTDGTFIYTGFRPKFLILKRTDAGADAWIMADTSIQPYNVVGNFLQPSQSDAELYAVMYDLLSNGFKLRQTYTTINTSGGTYIYMAFAENPFKYANAR